MWPFYVIGLIIGVWTAIAAITAAIVHAVG